MTPDPGRCPGLVCDAPSGRTEALKGPNKSARGNAPSEEHLIIQPTANNASNDWHGALGAIVTGTGKGWGIIESPAVAGMVLITAPMRPRA